MKRIIRTAALGLVLGLAALVVPDSQVAPTDASLVKVERARGVDLSPDVVWILALGSDARPGQNVLRSRADAIQLVGLNTKTGAATAIGIARDSWVSIPGHGSNRINAALYFGGPSLMADAVEGLVGIEPDYVFTTSFWGFRGMIESIGHITVNSKYAFSDPYLAPEGFKAGKNKLRHLGALAFSRIRKDLPGGDFDRSANQQETLRAIQRRIAANADQSGFIDAGVLSVLKHLDTNVGPAELFRIAQAVAMVDQSKITGCVVTGSFGNVNGASIIFPNRGQAQAWGDDARKDAVIKRC